MHLYWRVMEELKLLGETWVFNNPNLLRCYRTWLKKNADAIALSQSESPSCRSSAFTYKGISHSLN